jgi:uridylate kinase
MAELKYRRVLLKLSGEGFSGTGGVGLVGECLSGVAQQIRALQELKVQAAIVVGGGNFIRGGQLCRTTPIQRATGDQMGMLATVINALALRDTLRSQGSSPVVLTAREITSVCEHFTTDTAIRALEDGRVVILAGGTGNPYFTTDTCAALRAAQIQAEVLIKATKVDGVYSDDPIKNPSAQRFDKLTFSDVLQKDLRVMDHAAVSLCRENHIDIIVCNLMKAGNMAKAVLGQSVGTIISDQ